jgi:hypothetical protein
MGFRQIALAALVTAGLAGCAGDAADDTPLTPILIRDRLVGRMLSGTENGNGFLLRLEPNGVARVRGATAEFGRWRSTEAGLCLAWRDRPEQCAPVFEIGFARYHIGNMELTAQDGFRGGLPGQAPIAGPGHWDFGVPPP